MFLRIILKLFLIVATFSEMKAQNSFFELKGEALNSQKGDKIYLFYKVNNKIVIDSSEIKSNFFILKGHIEFPVKAFISNNREFPLDGINSSIIYLDPKKGKLKLDYKNFIYLSLENFRTHDEYLSLLKIKNSLYIKRDSISQLIQTNKKKLEDNEYNFNSAVLTENNIKFNKMMEDIHFREIEFDLDFAKKNIYSFVSPNLLLFWIKRKESVQLYDRINLLYNNLNENVKESYSAKELKRTIENLKNSKLGEKAPDFNLQDINQNVIRLDSFKGQNLILLDFWASWCGPCREDFEYLKEIYGNYNYKGLEIISISKDNNLKSWKEAIKKDKITNWKHISIKENYMNTLEEDYFVNSIPVKVLINKDGKIIGRWRGGGTENREELRNLIQRSLQ